MLYGFIGIGNLGSRLASNLMQAGHQLQIHDLDESLATELVARGARWSQSPAAAADGADAVITCMPNPAASSAVMLGDAGALETLGREATWLEVSTSTLKDIESIMGHDKATHINVLECPVTGGLHRAARGEMTMFVGGEKAVFEQHEAALEAMCQPVYHLGPLGSASLLKVITNMLCLIDLVAMGEALMLAKQGGLDLATCYRAICDSSGTSREFEDWAPAILNGSYDTGFTLDLALKDLGFGVDYGRDMGVPLALTTQVRAMLEQARETYGGEAWTPHVIKLLEEQVGIELRAEGFPPVY